jgi:hypothetical protein
MTTIFFILFKIFYGCIVWSTFGGWFLTFSSEYFVLCLSYLKTENQKHKNNTILPVVLYGREKLVSLSENNIDSKRFGNWVPDEDMWS